MDPLLDGLIGPEPGPGGEGFFVVHGNGFCGEFHEELRHLGLHGVGGGVGGGGGVVAVAVVPGLALVTCEGVVALDVARAARVDPHAALVAFDHLLAVVEGDAADAVHRPGPVHPLVRRVRALRAVRSPPFHNSRGN